MDRGTQALDRGMALLAAIVHDDGRSPASTVAGGLGVPGSSARRTLAALERHGLVRRISRGHYGAGPALTELAQVPTPHRELVAAARAPLSRLARAHSATAHLGVLDGDMVTYLAKEGRDVLFTREHQQLEAYCTGIGKALLAQLTETDLEHYLAGEFVPLTRNTLTDPGALRDELRRTRERGFAVDDREMAEDVACVAVSLRLEDGTRAAISLSAEPLGLPHPAILLPRLERCGRDIVARWSRAAAR